MKRHHFSLLAVLALCFVLVVVQISVRAEAAPGLITGDNAAQVQPLNSLKGQLIYYTRIDQSDEVVAGQMETDITLLNTRTGESQTIPKGNRIGSLFAVSPDGQYVIYLDKSTLMITLDNLKNKNQVGLIDGTAYQYSYQGAGLEVHFNADSQYVLVGDTYTQLFREWDVLTGKEVLYDAALGVILRSTSFSPDGKKLLNYGSGSLTLLDVLTGKTVLKLDLQPQSSAQFLPDHKTLMISGASQLEFWDTEAEQQISSIPSDPSVNWSDFELSADGKALAVSDSHTQTVQVWNIADLRHPEMWQPFESPFPTRYNYVKYKTDGKTLAFYSQSSKDLVLTDLESGSTATAHLSDTIKNLVLANNGQLIIIDYGFNYRSASNVEIWARDGLKIKKMASLLGNNFQLSADGSIIFTEYSAENRQEYRSQYLTIMYGIPTTERPQRPFMMLIDVVPKVVNVRAEPTNDAAVVKVIGGLIYGQGRDASGKYVYLPDYQGWVRADATYLKPPTGFMIEQLAVIEPAEVVAAAISPTVPATKIRPTPTSSPVPTATPGVAQLPTLSPAAMPTRPITPGGFEPMTIANHDQIQLLGVLPIGSTSVYNNYLNVMSSPDSNRVYGGNNGTDSNRTIYRVMNLRTLSLIQEFGANTQYYTSAIRGWSPDGHFLAYYGYDYKTGYIAVWDNQENIQLFTTDEQPYQSENIRVLFSPDSMLMAEGYPKSNTRVWDMNTRTLRFEVPTGTLIFSKDSQSLVLIDADLVRVYDTATGKMLKSLRFSALENLRVAHLSDDATSLVVISNKRFEYIGLKNGSNSVFETDVFEGYGAVDQIDFAADNSTFAVVSRGYLLHLFDAQNGKHLAAWKIRGDADVTYSPDGRFVATSNPLQFIDLTDGSITPLAGDYVGSNISFTADATSLLVSDASSTMVFGIPNFARSAWQPVTGHITSSGVAVRALPDQNASVIGYAKGDVKIGGRVANRGLFAAYLPERDGWIWGDKTYLTLDTPFDLLPVVNSDPK